MAIIYDMNYIIKCRYHRQKCLDLVDESRELFENELKRDTTSIHDKIKRRIMVESYRFANKLATDGVLYWAKREIVAIKKGALNK